MKDMFLNRAEENIKAAELLFNSELYNASVNRAYYSAFHIAIAALHSIGLEPTIDHRTIQALFADMFINRRKVLSSKYKNYLSDLQNLRNDADYKDGCSRKAALSQIKLAKEFYFTIISEILK